HLLGFPRTHCHRLLAEYRFATTNSREYVFEVQGIRRGDKDGVDLGRSAKRVGCFVNSERKLRILANGFLCLVGIAPPQASNRAVLRVSKAWHQTTHSMKAEA